MSDHAVKDDPAVKLRYLQRQIGVQDSDLDNFSGRLHPCLPAVLRRLNLENDHFESKQFPSDKKLQILASFSALISAQQKVDDTNQTGMWSTRHSTDPADKSHYRPIGYKESM